MVFSSAIFLFVFLPLVFLLTRLPRRSIRQQNLLLALASLVFYAFGQLQYLPLFLVSVLINFVSGAMLSGRFARSRAVLAVSVVMTLLCLVQSLLLFLTFTMAADVPVSYLYDARFDMFLTTFLCSYSAAMLGMLCSALFSNSTYMAPVLVIIQIVFSGMIFSLEGITKQISMFVSCHWAMNALAALCDLNNLPSYINMPQVGKISVTYTNPEFASEKFTLFTSWTMLLGLGLSALVLCLIVMSASRRMLFHPDFLGARAISNAIQTAKQVVSKVVAPAVGIAIAVVVILAFKENADFISLSSMGEMFGDFFSYLGTLFSDLPEFIEQLATEGL